MRAWLTIHENTDYVVCVTPDGASRLHAAVAAPEDFNTPPDQFPSVPVQDTGWHARLELPAELWPTIDTSSDRIAGTRLQRFQATVYRVQYATVLSKAELEVAGRVPSVVQPANWKPLRHRVWLVAVAGLLGLLAALGVTGNYLGQHTWFSMYGQGTGVLGLSFLAACALVVTLGGLLLGRRAWSPMRLWVPLGVGAALVVSSVSVAKVAAPSVKTATHALQVGHVREATVTAAALVELGIDKENGGKILDELHTRQIRTEQDLQALVQSVRGPWYSEQARTAALEHVTQLAKTKGDGLYQHGDQGGLLQVAAAVAPIAPDLHDALQVQAALIRASKCAESREFECVIEALNAAKQAPRRERQRIRNRAHRILEERIAQSLREGYKEKKPEEQLQLLTSAAADANSYHQLTGENPDIDFERLNAVKNRATAIVEQRRKAAEAAEAARQRAEAAAEAARERARARRQASLRLQCCDGTLSPSCLCSRASRRGCCSHHGGVCGCEAM